MEIMSDNQSPLIPLSQYIKSGKAPVEMRHLIFNNKKSLEDFQAIHRYGRKWLVSEPHLYQWLRKYGKHAGRVKTDDNMISEYLKEY